MSVRKKMSSGLLQGVWAGDFLPSFSTGEVVGWLELVTDWLHFTRSAQLGPVWESRAAASAGGGPLNEMNTQSWLEKLHPSI